MSSDAYFGVSCQAWREVGSVRECKVFSSYRRLVVVITLLTTRSSCVFKNTCFGVR